MKMATEVRGATVLAILNSDRDSEALRNILPQDVLLQTGKTLADVRRLLDDRRADVVLADSNLGDNFDWRDVLRAIESSSSQLPLIVTSGIADEALWAEVLNVGGFDVLALPFEPREVARVTDCAYRERLRHSPLPRGPGMERMAATAAAG